VIDLDRRAKAAQKTLDAFRLRPLRMGRSDCVALWLFHLQQLGAVPKGLEIKPYKTAAEAKRELKRLGVKRVGEIADRYFERVPWAFAMVGDLVESSAGRGLTSCGVVLGNGGRIVGYHQGIADGTADVLQANAAEVLGAWRVN
jgi:hypothetical protein